MNPTYEIGKKFFHETDEVGIHEIINGLSGVSPHISRYIIEFFDQVFSNPVLTYQQREMIVISTLISLDDTPNQLKWHINFGLKVGITPNAIIEIATHSIPFCGFPRALNAVGFAKQLFAEQNIEVNLKDELLAKYSFSNGKVTSSSSKSPISRVRTFN